MVLSGSINLYAADIFTYHIYNNSNQPWTVLSKSDRVIINSQTLTSYLIPSHESVAVTYDLSPEDGVLNVNRWSYWSNDTYRPRSDEKQIGEIKITDYNNNDQTITVTEKDNIHPGLYSYNGFANVVQLSEGDITILKDAWN